MDITVLTYYKYTHYGTYNRKSASMKNMNAVPLYEGIYSSAQNATFCVLENFYSFTPLKAQNIYMSHLTFASEIIAKSYIFAYPLEYHRFT